MDNKNYIVALDLGSSCVKLALGSVSDDWLTVEDVVSKEIASGGMTRGAIINRQVVSAAIRSAVDELERNNAVRISDIHTGVSDKNIKCATHDYFVYVSSSDGEIAREDVNKLHDGMNNVKAEDKGRILERIPQVYRVYGSKGADEVKDPVGCFGKKLGSTFTFVLGDNDMIVRYEDTLRGLTPCLTAASLTAGPMFAVKATASEEEIETGVVVLDIGRDTTDLCICKDGIVRYVRTIPLGSGDINTDIREYGIPVGRVEGLKKSHGRALAEDITEDMTIMASPNRKQSVSITRKALATIIEYRLKDIITFVKEEITDSGYKDKLQGGIILLTGGGANLAGIDKLFEREMGMEVRIARPDMHITPAEGKEDLLEKPEYASVIGMLQNAMANKHYNTVEVIRSIGVSTPRPEPKVVTPTPNVASKVEKVMPTVAPESVKTPVVEKPKAEMPKEEPRVERPVVEQTTPAVVEQTTPVMPPPAIEEERPKNALIDKVQGKMNDLLGGGKQPSDESDDDNIATPKKKSLLERLRDYIFPEDVEGDDYN